MSLLRKILLYRAFIRTVFSDIKSELKLQITSRSFFSQLFGRLGLSKGSIAAELDDLLEGSFELQMTDATAINQPSITVGRESSITDKLTGQVGVDIGAAKGSLSARLSEEAARNSKKTQSEKYSSVLIRTFDITSIIEDLRTVLNKIGIKRLFIFIDDFSELPEEAMQIFVDTVLAPLNNWSNELIKFKIAAYPGRTYLGKIDPTKIDQIYIDLYKLYGDRDVSTMEDKATDFTRRLINSRFFHYVNKSFDVFCDNDPDAVYRQLFYAVYG